MDPQLRAAIQGQIQALAPLSPILTSPHFPPKLYEVFVFCCALEALNNIGASVEPRNNIDIVTTALVFRLGPGTIYATASTPGFLLISFQGQEYELHNGLRVLGKSKVLHELDLCIIERDEATRCRSNNAHPSQSRIRFLAECKYYGTSLGLHLGREYVGLSSEFGARIKTLVSNTASPEIHALVTSHKGTENFSVSPANPLKVQEFKGWLATEFRQVLA